MTTEEKIAVMQAAVDGKGIELRSRKGGDWTPVVQPLEWDWWSYDYRVAKEPRVFYRNEYPNGFGLSCFDSDEAARDEAGDRLIRVVRFVEDMEHKDGEA